MTKRVYEFSKECGLSSKDLLKILHDGGFEVSSHMSVLSEEALSFLNNALKKQEPKKIKETPQPALAAKEDVKPVISVNKTSTEKKAVAPQKSNERQKPLQSKPVMKKEPEVAPKQAGIVLESMTVGDFATNAQKPVSEVILALLRLGVMATKNQMISQDAVTKLAKLFEIPILQPEAAKSEEVAAVETSVRDERMPIIVVIGHVDHGKTTLLDFIRKTRVADREKGGITQHLGAYEVQTPQGGIVFLDTPGHEAFALMRGRGVKVADIAVLVIAADDGIMPQTIEAIKQAQSVNVPMIVAINKIDKAAPGRVEKIKQDLVQYGVVAEEWGGQAVIVPISAKAGTGIDELLEMILLQSHMLELHTDASIPARGYVLESKMEKGLGPVATIICHYGTLSIGDFFRAGSVFGKVSALVNSAGKRVKSAGPAVPVLVAGFPTLPQAGDQFMVVSSEDVKKAKRETTTISTQPPMQSQISAGHVGQVLRFIFKADNASSLEALNLGLKKIIKNLPADQKISVVLSAIGDISESDIILARDASAIIYGFHVKAEAKAASFAVHEKVKIKFFDIIYKLFEEIEDYIEKSKVVKMISKKTGEAEVLKVFNIKGTGVIAGARIKSGMFYRTGSVIAYRKAAKIGEGPIKSLQRDKQSVKEVNTGYECAFLVDGFNDWQPGDTVECYIQVPEE